ncbi:uncharacterized protein [Rutidosis leptorrhynchoides]|uniref:uncharacterized protein n=1 Tax=Rutidosis leptorrhynchoides TaxID=125765 RepID=UPI003A99F855
MAWVKWDDVMLSFGDGGLNVGYIDSLGVPFRSSFAKVIGNGSSTSFWKDYWLGNFTLEDKFKRLARLESNINATVHERLFSNEVDCIGSWAWTRSPSGRVAGEFAELLELLRATTLVNNKEDSWRWLLSGNGLFSSRVLTETINSSILQVAPSCSETLRNNLVPSKVDVFVWQVRKRRIPVLTELDKRGIDLNSVRCPICDDGVETVDHSMVLCKLAYDIWEKVFDWWGLGSVSNLSISEMFCGNSNVVMSEEGQKIWQAVEWTCGYLIWKNRNSKVFKNKCWNLPVALSDIQVRSFDWIAKRSCENGSA